MTDQRRRKGTLCCRCGHSGFRKFCRKCKHERCDSCAKPPAVTELTARELSIAEAFGRGERTTAIAIRMNLSPKTISEFARRAADKLKLKDTMELRVHMAERRVANRVAA